jgi:hypothetical protein
LILRVIGNGSGSPAFTSGCFFSSDGFSAAELQSGFSKGMVTAVAV